MTASKRLCIVVLVFASSPVFVWGSEFANFYGLPEEQVQQSSIASVEALEGLIRILSAIQDRELGKSGSGNLREASASLRSAAERVRSIRVEDHDRRLVSIGEEEDSFLKYYFSRMDMGDPVYMSNLAEGLATATDILADRMSVLADSADSEPVFPRIRSEIVMYLYLCDIITRVARATYSSE